MNTFVLLRKIATLFFLATAVAVLSMLGLGLKKGGSILGMSVGAPTAFADAAAGGGEWSAAESGCGGGAEGSASSGCEGCASF